MEKLVDSATANGAAAPKQNNYKALSNIRIPDFFSGAAVSVKEYRDFKKDVQADVRVAHMQGRCSPCA